MSLTFLIIPTLVHGPRFTKIIKNILDFFENSYLKFTVHGSQKKFWKMSLIFLRISIWSARSTVHGSQKNNTRKFWFQFLIGDFTDATYNSTRSTVHKNYKKCPWFFREFLSEVHGPRYTKKIWKMSLIFLRISIWSTQSTVHKNI